MVSCVPVELFVYREVVSSLCVQHGDRVEAVRAGGYSTLEPGEDVGGERGG